MKMLNIVKETTRAFDMKWKNAIDASEDKFMAKIDIVGQLSEFNASILLSCAFGHDVSD